MRRAAAAGLACAALAACANAAPERPPARSPAPSPGAATDTREPRAPAPPERIVAYHESGAWERDITAIVERARRFLAARTTRRAAIVLDIDDTSLSSYACLEAVGFDRERARCAESGGLPAIPQTRELYRFARARGVTVFFITGRREQLRAATLANLRAAGYRGRLRVIMRPDRQPAAHKDGWKARERRALSRRGHRIVVNLGDQHSDLDGGYALRTFKLPNPMYVIPEA
ncbi:MAG TPA: HAD family acid phosphatase [Solirubrobacteraceae bacterium]|nr:HAD family acid phosphatase [Solirubrobacteraceae bacterium]